jgi:hypothetical protein
LYVAIGAERLDCAIVRRSGRRSCSSEDERIGLSFPPDAGKAALLEAIVTLEQKLLNRANDGPIREVRALVADSWLAQTEVPWTSAMKRQASAQASAAAMIAQAGFDGDWARPMSLDDAPYGMPRLVVAYPQALVAALERLAAALDARQGSILPFSIAAWETLPRSRQVSSLAILDRGLLVFANGSDSTRLGEVAVRHAPSGEDETRLLRETWQRTCLRRPELAGLESVAVLALDESVSKAPGTPFDRVDTTGWPGSGLPAPLRLAVRVGTLRHVIDAIPQHPRPSLGTYAMLMLGAVLLSAMAWQLTLNAREIGNIITRIEEIRPAPAPVVVEPAWNREELPKVLAVNAAIRELNLPVAAILRALQPPPDIRVAVLGLDASASGEDTSSVKVFAEAPTGAEMARYVNFVSARRPFTSAYLNKHEIVEAGASRSYRFTLEMQWAK